MVNQNLKGFYSRLNPNRIVYGVVAGSPDHDNRGLALGSTVASGYLPSDDFYQVNFRHIISHEIGHCMGLSHDVKSELGGLVKAGACGERAPIDTPDYPFFEKIPTLNGALRPALGPMSSGPDYLVYGFDTLTHRNSRIEPVLDPNRYFDLMSYCTAPPLEFWPSLYTYNALFEYMQQQFKVYNPANFNTGTGANTNDSNWLLVNGLIDEKRMIAQQLRFLPIENEKVLELQGSGNFSVATYDTEGNQLQKVAFNIQPASDEETPTALNCFEVPIRANPLINRVDVLKGDNIIASQIVSATLLSVSSVVISSESKGVFGRSGVLAIDWNLNSPVVQLPISYFVEYSADGGKSWKYLAVDYPSTHFEIETGSVSGLTPSTNGLIKLFASNGFSTSQPSYSRLFSINDRPPSIDLIGPKQDQLFVANSQLVLRAKIEDPHDGTIDGLAVSWVSNKDGRLGSGKQVFLEALQLTEGLHEITVSATNSLGLSTNATVHIAVVREAPPSISVQRTNFVIGLIWPNSSAMYVLESSIGIAGSWNAVTNILRGVTISESSRRETSR